MTGLIIWVVFGGLVGWVASIIMRTNDDQGMIANIVVGIVGAIIGGFISQSLGGDGVSGFNMSSFLLSVGGAIVLLAIVKMFSRSSR